MRSRVSHHARATGVGGVLPPRIPTSWHFGAPGVDRSYVLVCEDVKNVQQRHASTITVSEYGSFVTEGLLASHEIEPGAGQRVDLGFRLSDSSACHLTRERELSGHPLQQSHARAHSAQ